MSSSSHATIEREQHVERQTPHRGRRVELLRHGDERGVMGIQHIDDRRRRMISAVNPTNPHQSTT
jgi:hypothetical protein